MSGAYTQVMLGVAEMMTGAGADAAYEAAYGTYYSKYQGMQNAANAKVAAEANIAALTQDKINTDKIIDMNQDKAEAMAKVAAAASGTSGGSVDAVIYQTQVNSSVAKQNNTRDMRGQIEQQLSQVYDAQSTMLSLDGIKVAQPSLSNALLQTGMSYLTSHGDQLMEGIDGLFASGSETPATMSMNYQLPSDNSLQIG